MSVESARAFCMRLMADDEFRDSLGKAASPEAIAEIMKKENYDFSQHDLLKIVSELTGKKKDYHKNITSIFPQINSAHFPLDQEKEVVGFYRDEVAADNPAAVENVTAWFRSL